MFIELLLFIFFGILTGVITGLIPGLHPNTIFAIFVSFALFLPGPSYGLFVFVISLAISNTFIDFIPSIIFGAPEEDSVLSVLPGHKYLLEGRGYDAVFLTVMGGLIVFFLTILALPFLLYFLPVLYTSIHGFIHILLLLVVFWMIMTERGVKKIFALAVFLMSGIFGFITLNNFTSEQILFPALTGLFAFSTLLTSLTARGLRETGATWFSLAGSWVFLRKVPHSSLTPCPLPLKGGVSIPLKSIG